MHNGLDQDVALSLQVAKFMPAQIFAHYVAAANTTTTFVWSWQPPELVTFELVRDDTQQVLVEVPVCFAMREVNATIIAGGRYTDRNVCVGGLDGHARPRHGTVNFDLNRKTGANTLTYRSAAGYIGSDSFTWNCLSSYLEVVRYHIKVLPRPVAATALRPTSPAPAAALPATGAAQVPATVEVGLGLVVAGALVTRLARRRRGRVRHE